MKKHLGTLSFLLCIGCAALILTAASRHPIYTEQNTLIQTGRGKTATDGTCTNTFTTVFTALPVVTVTQEGAVTTVSNIITEVATNYFVYKAGGPNVTNAYTAIGKR